MFAVPVKNLKSLGLREDSVVADLGAGTGYYTLAVGQIVIRGKVYAVEIQKDLLATIKNKITEAKLGNVEIIWGNIEKLGGTKLGDGVVDAVIASNVLFQVDHKDQFIQEIKRILKPQGKVLFVDWSIGSPLSPRGAIAKDQARKMFEDQGFILDREIDAGERHYGMILIKSSQ